MDDLTPILNIAGIAAGAWLVEQVLEHSGHGDKVVMVRVVSFGVTAWYTLRTFLTYLHRVASMFGVYI